MVWIADPLSFSYVIAPVGTPLRPVANQPLEQALAYRGPQTRVPLCWMRLRLVSAPHAEILKKQKLWTNEAAKLDPEWIGPYVSDDVGLWAAVLAHQVVHVVKHHQYKAYVRAATLKATRKVFREQMLGHTWVMWAYLVTLTGGRALEMKLSRHDELEADRLGLMMMAEAGIHPDYAAALMRKLHIVMGDQNDLLSDHPRWETREKNFLKARKEALSIFNRRYPNAVDSPGGVPPSP